MDKLIKTHPCGEYTFDITYHDSNPECEQLEHTYYTAYSDEPLEVCVSRTFDRSVVHQLAS